jgi:hypothetical protein
MWKQLTPYIVPLFVAALIVRRSGRAKKVRLVRMWIIPAFLGLALVATLSSEPAPGPLVIVGFLVAAFVGGGLGYLRASHLHLSIDPKTGEVSSRATTIGTLLIVFLFMARFGLKQAFPELSAPHHHHGGAGIVQWSDIFLTFTVAMLIAQTVWIQNRIKPLLAEHAARTSGAASPE